ncbi:Arc family DNA-binding protein [Burkholderia cenocepacia]|nr:Arc family DNA-binding protein [Burkholderia cenocepacia]
MKLRLPADLKDRLSELAAANGRSLNAEVLLRLEASISGDASRAPVSAAAVDERTLDLFAEKVGQLLDEREKRRSKQR